MKNLILFLLSLLIATNCYSKTLKNEEDIKTLLKSVMEKVKKVEYQAAFELLKPYSPLSSVELDSVALQTAAKRKKFEANFGKTYDVEFVRLKKVGSSLIQVQYIEKCQSLALVWKFYFYKLEDDWIINAFFWNDKFRNLFDE